MYTRQNLIDIGLKYVEETGNYPGAKDFSKKSGYCSKDHIYNQFGNWINFLQELGADDNLLNTRRKLSKNGIYDWKEINEYYNSDKNITFADCKNKYGFAAATWDKAVKRGDIIIKDRSIKNIDLFVKNSNTKRSVVRRRLLRDNLIPYSCEECNLENTWNNKELSLHLDHINGIYNDHRLANLRFLCPNCHSQTASYAGRNKPYKK